jgi:putative ABC transport system permease protein
MYQPNPSNLTKTDEHTNFIRVVGVVRSVRLEDLSGKGNPEGAYYFPFAQDPSNTYTLAIRAAGDSAALVPTIRAKMAAVDPELALFDIRTMDERQALSLSSRRMSLSLAVAFGVLALFLAAVGIYGVLAYLVTQRRREIGIRVALGSTPSGVVKLILREGFVLVGTGLILGISATVVLRRVLLTQIYGVGPLDPPVVGSVALLLGMAALAACVVPARRALQVHPAVVLKEP